MIDCVGYIVPDALGHYEDGEPRMVMTPWSETAMPFEKAAELGTQKVITEHSTIGLVVTTDGSIGEIPREDYVEAEERVVRELKELGEPFIVVMNTVDPRSSRTTAFCAELSAKYEVPVTAVDCLSLDGRDITRIMATVLYEFPVREVGVSVP